MGFFLQGSGTAIMSISSIPFLLDCPPTSRLPQTGSTDCGLKAAWVQIPLGPVPQASNSTNLVGLSLGFHLVTLLIDEHRALY